MWLVLKGVLSNSGCTVLQWLEQCIKRGANPDISPPSWDRAQKAQANTSPSLGQAVVFYQCWPATLLVAATQPHLGAPVIPLLCHLRSVYALYFHLEKCDKGNTLKVCKKEIQWTFGGLWMSSNCGSSWDANLSETQKQECWSTWILKEDKLKYKYTLSKSFWFNIIWVDIISIISRQHWEGED